MAAHARRRYAGKKSIGFVVVIRSTSRLLEMEQQHALDELLLELLVAELRRHDLARRTRGRPARSSASARACPAAPGFGAALDCRARRSSPCSHRRRARSPRGCAAALLLSPAALRRAAGDLETLDGALDLRRGAIADAAAARVAAQRGRVDAAAARPDARRDQTSARRAAWRPRPCRRPGSCRAARSSCRRATRRAAARTAIGRRPSRARAPARSCRPASPAAARVSASASAAPL